MKELKFLLSLLVLIVFSSSLLAQMSSSNFSIEPSVLDEAGGTQQSTQFAISSAVGLPMLSGKMSSTNFDVLAGFFTEYGAAAGLLVYVPDTSGFAGASIDIPVMVPDLTGQNILGLSLTLEADTLILKPTGAVVAGTILEQWGNVTTNIVEGQITVAGASAEQLAGAGVLVYIQYQVNSSATAGQTTTIQFVDVTFNEGQPAANPQDGLFTVSSGFEVAGTVHYYASQSPVANVSLRLNGYSAMTGTDGNFSFAAVPGGTYTLLPSKDGEAKQSISAFDASFILRDVVGLIDLTPYQKIAADVSGNGGVSPFDASYILRYVVGIITEFPVGDDWTFVPSVFAINDTNWMAAPDSILYDPLDADKIGQDFEAIVYGDVTGNWTSPGQMALSVAPKSYSGIASLSWGKVSKNADNGFQLPLQGDISGDLYAAEIKIRYDSEILSLLKITPGKDVKDFQLEYLSSPEELSVALAGVEPITSSCELINLEFKTSDSQHNSETSLEISEVVLNEGMMMVNISQNHCSFNPALPEKTELLQNYPNPFNPETTISFQLAKQGRVILKIYDIRGNHVRTLMDEEKDAGSYSLLWNAKDENNNDVASGVYFYRMKTNGFVNTKKLLLIR